MRQSLDNRTQSLEVDTRLSHSERDLWRPCREEAYLSHIWWRRSRGQYCNTGPRRRASLHTAFVVWLLGVCRFYSLTFRLTFTSSTTSADITADASTCDGRQSVSSIWCLILARSRSISRLLGLAGCCDPRSRARHLSTTSCKRNVCQYVITC